MYIFRITQCPVTRQPWDKYCIYSQNLHFCSRKTRAIVGVPQKYMLKNNIAMSLWNTLEIFKAF